MKIVLATRNRDKTREITAMLAGLEVEVLALDAFPGAPETVEDGTTLEANAWKKAREARAHTGLSALADDTGLEVDALDGAPGVFAARYAGENATYDDNCRKLIEAMKSTPTERRGARFRTVMALALVPADVARLADTVARNAEVAAHFTQDTDGLLSEGLLNGVIAPHARGSRGFGYDPVFVDGASGRTLAEMTLEEKNATSHRYRALLEMREMLLRYRLVREKVAPL
jgi:XTP/dITP diphosphohydrolase